NGTVATATLCINDVKVIYSDGISEYKSKDCNDMTYSENILNGTDPVLGSNMIPVRIKDDGTVIYADLKDGWYDYSNKEWANAVMLSSGTYNVGDIIPESAVRSYFVWIPRYKYKIFDEGLYTGVISSKPTESIAEQIEIVFENKDATASTGSTEGSWLTHPAFTSFNTNGIWVGKFETGYLGATTTAGAQVNSSDSSKIIVKPDVFSWRSNTVYNMFVAAYNYARSNDSHMMKNTEWGAVAYLSHSKYGINKEININNNSSFKTGYSATEGSDQTTYPGTYGNDFTKTLGYATRGVNLLLDTEKENSVHSSSDAIYHYYPPENFDLQVGQTYTLSYDAYTDNGTDQHYVSVMKTDKNTAQRIANGVKPTTKYMRYSLTFVLTYDLETTGVMFVARQYNWPNNSGTTFIKNVQLEEGDNATRYEPFTNGASLNKKHPTTTGNITGIYDMSGGAHEYMASYKSGQLGTSGFDETNIAVYNPKYFDVYSTSSSTTNYNYRILGDATGEMGPFYNYADGDGTNRYHNNWYADYPNFVVSSYPWFLRGGFYYYGVLAGQFNFSRYTGAMYFNIGSRLVLAPN
ncbi:MAG: hypothetical protein PHU94_04015, partial [Bacilli bacterium]|nr:hypothetical protein [Bacilli bacterium]